MLLSPGGTVRETGAVPEGAVGIVIDVSVRRSQHRQCCFIFVKCQGSASPLYSAMTRFSLLPRQALRGAMTTR